MARRKITKRSKRQPKALATANTALVKMEKSFHQIPLKLAALLNKEVASLKKKQLKLKHALDKVTLQVKKSEKRLAATAAKARGALGKKQLKAAQKKLNDKLKTQHALDQQWQQSIPALETTMKTQAKFIAVNKHLESFEKEWAKQSKPAKPAKTKAEKTSRRGKTATVTDEVMNETMEPTFEPAHDQNDVDETETAEMTS